MLDDNEKIEVNDIVVDILQRVQLALTEDGNLTVLSFEKIEFEVRRDWNGERPYIGKKLLTDEYISQRRREICRMARAGESFAFIGRKFGISKQRAYKIFKG